MQFNFRYANGVSQIQMAAFEMAGKIWSTYLTDEITINIAVDIQKDFVGNTIGGAISRVNNHYFSSFRNELINDITSEVDRTASESSIFNDTDQFEVRFDKDFSLEDEKKASKEVQVNSANAKALNLQNGQSEALDGYIVMRDLTGTNTKWDYNFTRSNTTPKNSVDFISVAIHEIGHVLGFQSSIDRPWFDLNSKEYQDSLDNRALTATPLDLFRFSEKSQIGSNSDKLIDLAVGGNPFLSLGGDALALGYFDTGVEKSMGGSGKQASHWQSGGIMDAEIQRGAMPKITDLDLTAFDVIGWDIAAGASNQTINYARLAEEAMQIARQKTTQDISNAVASMISESDAYGSEGGVTPLTEARRGRVWWQEYFARTGDLWQSIKNTFGEKAIFDSIEGDDIEFLETFDQYVSTDSLAEDSFDSLTGKSETDVLVGEDASLMNLGSSSTSQFIDFGFFKSSSGVQNSNFSISDAQLANQGLDFDEISDGSDVALGSSNQRQRTSISDDQQLFGDSLTPWWLGETSWWAVR